MWKERIDILHSEERTQVGCRLGLRRNFQKEVHDQAEI